jgi:hypothetical protein
MTSFLPPLRTRLARLKDMGAHVEVPPRPPGWRTAPLGQKIGSAVALAVAAPVALVLLGCLLAVVGAMVGLALLLQALILWPPVGLLHVLLR